VKRILQINELQTMIKEVVEAARKNLTMDWVREGERESQNRWFLENK